MKKIAVFFTAPEKKDYPLNKDEYWHAYQELDQEITKAGAEFCIVRSQATYMGEGIFSKSWKYKNNELIENGQVKVDVVYDKGNFITDKKVPVLNNEKVNKVCTDKWLTYQSFLKYCPTTLLASNEKEFLLALNKIASSPKVIKPIDGEEGKNVFIGDNKYLISRPKTYPILVQEFIDSSGGIPGIVEGIHDFRIAIMNGEIVYSFIRTPPTDSFLANVAQGGKQINVDVEKIPSSALALSADVDAKMSKYGDRFYGIDMALSSTGWKIIELNSQLGLDENKRHPIFIEVKKKLTKLLLKITTNY